MGTRVLIVDDSELTRQMIMDALDGEGYELSTAVDGVEGLERADALKPDIMILDLTMPKMDGLDVCTEYRALPDTGHTKIIICTTRASEFDRMVGEEVGADAYLGKPFSDTELKTLIKNLL